MKCTNCGREIDNDSNYCEYCGTKQNITENTPSGFVDLGLPSGTLWKNENEQDFYDYDKAVLSFGKKLPTNEQLKELKNLCQWTWIGNGYKVTGPNGKSIILPAAGYRFCDGNIYGAMACGAYWFKTPSSKDGAFYINFNSGEQQIELSNKNYELSVRLVQD